MKEKLGEDEKKEKKEEKIQEVFHLKDINYL